MRIKQVNTGNRTSHRRRGSLFHYYMVYLLLSSVLLTTAGLCMHALLKADRVDAADSRYLKTLLRMEVRLRSDTFAASNLRTQPATLVATTADAVDVRWVIDSSTIVRESLNDGVVTSSDRFSFRPGTELSFRSDAAIGAVSLVVVEPPPTATQSGISRPRNTIEILLQYSAHGPATEETSAGTKRSTLAANATALPYATTDQQGGAS